MVGTYPNDATAVNTTPAVPVGVPSPTSIGPIPASVFYNYVDAKDNILADLIDRVKDSVKDKVNYVNPFTLDNVNSLQLTKKADGSIRSTDIRPMAEQLLSGPLANRLDLMWANVKDAKYGAVGDNVTDDTAAIQAAVYDVYNRFKGGVIYLPRGKYRKTQDISVPDGANITFVGDGMGATILRTDSSTAKGIVFLGTGYLTCGGGVQNMTIESGPGLVASGYFGAGSSGKGIIAVHQNDNWGIQNVCIANFGTGLALYACTNGQSSNFRIMFIANDGILLEKGSDNVTGAGHKFIGGKVSNFGYSADATNSNGIRIRASGGDFFSTIDVTAFGTGVRIDPPTGQQVAYCFFHKLLADTSLGDGYRVDGSLGGNIYALRGSLCWASYSGANGLLTIGSGLQGFRVLGMGLRENRQRGWYHLGGAGIELEGADIHKNSQAANLVYPGVEIANNCNDWALIGGSIGNRESGLGFNQTSAVKIAGSSSHWRIVGVNCLYPGTGFSPVDYNRSLQTDFAISSNLPRQQPGLNYSEAHSYSSANFQNSGSTLYYGFNGTNANPGIIPWIANKPSVVGRISVTTNTAISAGQSIVATLFKNGSATGVTTTISPGSFTNIGYGSITFSDGDTFEIQVVTSGSASGVIRVYAELEP